MLFIKNLRLVTQSNKLKSKSTKYNLNSRSHKSWSCSNDILKGL